MPLVLMADLAKDSGLNKVMGSLMVSMLGVSSVVIRLAMGFCGRWCDFDVIILFAIGCAIRGAAVVVMPLMSYKFWYAALCNIFNGVGYGLQFGMLTATFARVFPADIFISAVGIGMVPCAMGALSGPPFGGLYNPIISDYCSPHIFDKYVLFIKM